MRIPTAALTVVLLCAAAMVPATTSGAEPRSSSLSAGPPPPQLDDYSLGSYAAEADTVPTELVAALDRDLGITPEEYLARADAASDASEVIDFLAAEGVDPLDVRLDGTTLVVSLESPDAAALVESTGAVVRLGAPAARDFSGLELDPLADLRGGTGYILTNGADEYRCTIGFTGYSVSSAAAQFATAGHCDGTAQTAFTQTRPGTSGSYGAPIGSPVSGSFRFGGGYDVGVVAVTASGWTPKPEVVTWGGGAGSPLASAPVLVRDQGAAVTGGPICKSGSTTGWTCGEVLAVDQDATVDGQQVNLVISDLCMLEGDSGGSALSGSTAVGINSAGSWIGGCDRAQQPDAVAAFFPMVSAAGKASVMQKLGSSWEIAVALERPVISVPAAGVLSAKNGVMSGTVARSTTRHSVAVYFDGSSTPRTSPVSSTGTWSISLAGLGIGRHSYAAKTTWGARNASTALTGSVAMGPSVDRITGPDRYSVAVAISQRAFPGTAPIVYIATGQNYPDALSAAPAAVKNRGPLLLTPTSSLPAVVADEIARLRPARIVVVGGPASVSPVAFDQLRALAPTTRITGADRYAASRNLIASTFDTASFAYVVTGTNFPDALSAGAAGGASSTPVLLVNGPSASVGSESVKLLDDLGVTRVKIAGGPNSVSGSIERELSSRWPVSRFAGADRFVASQSINADAFTTASTVYLSTGFNYPDALAGAALAGKGSSPLFVVPTDCVPRGVIAAIEDLGATKVVLLGGPASLTPAVESLTPCGF